jgi:hypothetical protein
MMGDMSSTTSYLVALGAIWSKSGLPKYRIISNTHKKMNNVLHDNFATENNPLSKDLEDHTSVYYPIVFLVRLDNL